MKLLLHICCGPCATATVRHWRGQGLRVTGFFYNPNVQPFLEFRRRLTAARDLADQTDLPLREHLAYDPARWFQSAAAAPDRCAWCVGSRLERTAAWAKQDGFDAFGTTLSISPYQDHEAIRRSGEAAAALHGVGFVYDDLTRLYPESRRLAREYGLYRQKYCGCIVSEWERYRES